MTSYRLSNRRGESLTVESKEQADYWTALGYSAEGDQAAADTGYGDRTVAELKAEIESRNADREDDARISTTGNKADLIAALEADDQAGE